MVSAVPVGIAAIPSRLAAVSPRHPVRFAGGGPVRRLRKGVETLAEAGKRDRDADAFLGRLEDDEHRLLAGPELLVTRFSSMITSATQPFGRQRMKPAVPMSVSSMRRPRPRGSRTPSGARTRRMRACLSAVFRTITDRPTFSRSSRGDELHDHALLALCAGGRVAAQLPVAMLRLHLALGKSQAGNGEKQG